MRLHPAPDLHPIVTVTSPEWVLGDLSAGVGRLELGAADVDGGVVSRADGCQKDTSDVSMTQMVLKEDTRVGPNRAGVAI